MTVPPSRVRPTRSAEWGTRLGLLVAALLASLALGEVAARLPFFPGDLLMPVLTRNDVLGLRVRPGTSGADAWGFRNLEVPAHADLVAIGDSFTYGYSATRVDAWPAQVARLAGLSVYNLGMGGWGPDQYYCALRIFGLRLSPRIVA